MSLRNELRRKAFHHLAVVYLLVYWFLPRPLGLLILGLFLAALSVMEFLRLRRPELNAWCLAKFRGLHRESEVLHPSSIFWTLLGCWGTMLIFTNFRIVLPALGFLVFGDAAAALCGKKWGKRVWPQNPPKTLEGSAGFVVVSALWASLFLRWPVAIAGALSGAWIESRKLPFHDNFWLPLLSATALSAFNLVLGR